MNDLWLISTDHAIREALATMQAAELAARASSFLAPDYPDPYVTRGTTAYVGVRGVLIPSGPDWYQAFGLVPMRAVREALRAADADPGITELVLEIDSPGGTAAGVEALVAAVGRLKKPCSAHVETQACSGAFWLASATKRIIAEPGAIVGSIGVIAAVVDASRYMAEEGLALTVIRTAPAKGGILFGEQVTEANLAPLRARVEEYFAAFKGAVQSGRALTDEQLSTVITGEVWSAQRARQLGLVDDVMLTDDPAAIPIAVPDLPDPGEEDAMSQDQIRQLEEKLAAESAKSAAAQAQLAAITQNSKNQIVAAAIAEGRILPPAVEAVNKYAAVASVEDLRAFVAAMPVQVAAQPAGTVPSRPPVESSSVLASLSERDRSDFEARGYAEVIKLGENATALRKQA
jgi:signal peptide peptidase SppA